MAKLLELRQRVQAVENIQAVTRTLAFAPTEKPSAAFWATGSAWGTCTQRPAPKGTAVELRALGGELALAKLVLTGLGEAALEAPRTLRQGEGVSLTVTKPKTAGRRPARPSGRSR